MSSLPDPTTPATAHPKWAKPVARPKPTPNPTPRAGPTPPPPPPAVLPGMAARADLSALLGCYAADGTFRAALGALSDLLLQQHGAATGADDARSAFLADWKLDRLPVIDGLPAGRQALDHWLATRFIIHAAGDRLTADEADALAGSFGGGVLFVSDAPHVPDTEAPPMGRTEAGAPVHRLRVPRPAEAPATVWNPSREARADYEARRKAEERRQHDAVVAEFRAAGYRFRDAAHRREQHAGWLFRRLVYGLTYPAIADTDGVSDSAVRRGVADLAARLDMDPNP